MYSIRFENMPQGVLCLRYGPPPGATMSPETRLSLITHIRTSTSQMPAFLMKSSFKSTLYDFHRPRSTPHAQSSLPPPIVTCKCSFHRKSPSCILFDIRNVCRRSDKWEVAYDCQLQQEILFRVLGHSLPADNPQQAQSASVVGSSGNMNCRYDEVGGTEAQCETDEGYHSHFQVQLLCAWPNIADVLTINY